MLTPTTGARVLARTPHPSPAQLAMALSLAFLAAEAWTAAGLLDAGAQVLGARRRWLGPLARLVLGAYHRRPADAPRELAGFVAAAPPFLAALSRAGERRTPIRLAGYLPAEPELTGSPRMIPPVAGLGDLAGFLHLTQGELDWFADAKHWNRLAGKGPLQHYRYVWRQRPGRTPRLLEIPGLRLRTIQRRVHSGLIGTLPVHGAAHGFVPGRSAATGAALHTGAEVVLTADLTSFFARVSAGRIYGMLRRAGYPEAVAHSLTGLCSHAVPPWALNAMPPGGGADERFALRQALRRPHLPQGAPTSPTLANLALSRLDVRLQGLADASGATYTRYADDLAFSGGPALARRADAFLRAVGRIAAEEHHQLNRAKTTVRKASVRQQVTGVVVNSRTNAARGDFDALKATLHNCIREGPASQNRTGHADFRAHLLGRIGWMEFLNPLRGAKLRREFDRIRW
jgi:hypothetical protein